MFFWGSYNFQVTQQTEHPDRPPLRYPVYLPPTAALVQADLCTPARLQTEASTASAATITDEAASTPLETDTIAAFIESSRQAAVLHGTGGRGRLHSVADASAQADVAQALMTLSTQRLALSTVACGMKHMVAVLSRERGSGGSGGSGGGETKAESVVVGLGSNHSGQLGSAVATYATALSDLKVGEVLEGRVVSVACGAKHTLLCTETGCVYVCGDNSVGQLGLPAPLGTKSQAGLNNGAPCCPHFVQVSALVHISKVFANQHASFALDQRGKLYSWGDAQHGHLGHNTLGEALDPDTLKIVTEHVRSPRLVQWFQQQHVRVVDVAVGKSHLVCCSEDDVYTCGDGAYGKLGSGSATLSLEPVKVVFPERKQTEKLVGIAAGDDHTLVLKENPVIGSVMYFFGKLSNADGQLTPMIVSIPGMHEARLTRVVAGKGTQCACVSADGRLFVWGKHSYAKMYNGTNASSSRSVPSLVEVLDGFPLTGLAVGGNFCVAYAGADGARAVGGDLEPDEVAPAKAEATKSENVKNEEAQEPAPAQTEKEEDGAEAAMAALATRLHPWDVVVPQDARVSTHYPDGDVDEEYEQGRAALLAQYLGERLGTAYAVTLPATPAKTITARYAYAKLGGKGLTVAQKVRLWMSDVYALGTIVRIGAAPQTASLLSTPQLSSQPMRPLSQGGSLTPRASPVRGSSVKREASGAHEVDDLHAAEVPEPAGTHVRIEWQRDDWDEESLSLFSDDETLDEENENRWQPFWYEAGPDGNYSVGEKHR